MALSAAISRPMIVCCLYGLSSSTCSSKRPLISKHKSRASGYSHALDRNPDANYRRCVDRDHDLYRATRLSSPSAGRSSNPGQVRPALRRPRCAGRGRVKRVGRAVLACRLRLSPQARAPNNPSRASQPASHYDQMRIGDARLDDD